MNKPGFPASTKSSIRFESSGVKLSLLAAIFFLFITSCSKKLETVRKSAVESLPSITVHDFVTTYSDSALRQVEMSSPLVERYTNKKPPYSEFREGIHVLFYDGKRSPVGTLSSKYARVMEDKRIWELKDSVVAINEKNEVLETELLYWDQPKEIVYTDRFVKLTSSDQIVMGTGLESDSRFLKPKIRNVSAIIYLNDEK
ncbi:MAG: LPS export ABC transporter periplasmic protein LptC [Bacteroidales bacterium]